MLSPIFGGGQDQHDLVDSYAFAYVINYDALCSDIGPSELSIFLCVSIFHFMCHWSLCQWVRRIHFNAI